MLPVVTLDILVWLFHKLTIVSRGIYSLKFVVTEQYTNCLKHAIIDFRHFLIGSRSFDKVWLLNMFILNFFLLFPNRPTSELPNCFNSSVLNLVIFESSYAKLSWKERIKHRHESFSNFGIHEKHSNCLSKMPISKLNSKRWFCNSGVEMRVYIFNNTNDVSGSNKH